MTDAEAQHVHEQVEALLMSREGRLLDIGNPEHLAKLSKATRPFCPEAEEDELLIVTAMCWLGPMDAGPPPARVREDLVQHLRQAVDNTAERADRAMEFVIAYGCGKWRLVEADCEGWTHLWQGAMRGLVRALEPAVGQANRWLAEHVAGFPRDRNVPYDPQYTEDAPIWSDAWLLANRLIHPEERLSIEGDETLTITCTPEGTECTVADQGYQQFVPPGAKAVWTLQEPDAITLSLDEQASELRVAAETTLLLVARDEDVLIKNVQEERNQQLQLKINKEITVRGPLTLDAWECTCGTAHCKERHRLESWNPEQRVRKTAPDIGSRQKEETGLTLWNFAASAVKGPQLRIQTGSFTQGLYFPLLSQEGCGS